MHKTTVRCSVEGILTKYRIKTSDRLVFFEKVLRVCCSSQSYLTFQATDYNPLKYLIDLRFMDLMEELIKRGVQANCSTKVQLQVDNANNL